MKKLKLDKRKKVLFAAAAVLLLAGLVYRVFPTLDGFYATDEEIALKEKQLSKYKGRVNDGDALAKRIRFLEQKRVQARAGLLEGKTPSLAAVDIQNLLNEITAKSGIEARTVRVLKPEELSREDYVGIPVQFTINSNVRQLKEILYGIETSTKSLTVKTVRINVPRISKVEDIQSDITVSGFMEKGEE